MFKGKLFASKLPNSYAIGTPNGPDLVDGQALDVLLGGHWIAGRIRYSDDTLHVVDIDGQHVGAYKQNHVDGDDTVVEASEESFQPATHQPGLHVLIRLSWPLLELAQSLDITFSRMMIKVFVAYV